MEKYKKSASLEVNTATIMLGVIVFIALLLVGWLANDLYRHYNGERTINGLWISGNLNYDTALERANTMDNSSDWVCVNTQGMDVPQIIETCTHEASHELFAQQCSKDVNKCLKEVGLLK